MPAIVLDASLTIAVLLPDETTTLIAGVLPLLTTERVLVPAIWHTEVGNAVLTADRTGRMTAAERRHGFAWLARLGPEIEAPNTALTWGQVHDLAQRHRLTLYDATYLELAMRHGARLATLDRALRRAAEAESVPLLPA